MDFARGVGQGHGDRWSGVLFRKTYPQLRDVIGKSMRWFPRIFPDAQYNQSEHIWRWPGGENLALRFMRDTRDYWHYHGHELPWIGWEELTTWPNLECYESMKSCNRTSVPGIPRRIRSTTNPYGVGHASVKRYFIDPIEPGEIETDDAGLTRTRVTGDPIPRLAEADPEYQAMLASITDPGKRKAWLDGGWDIVVGGALDDLWNRDVHVVEPFKVPSGWKVNRSFDWGSSSPFSVLWFAESNGTEVRAQSGTTSWPRGTVFVISEWYGDDGSERGLKMTARSIAEGILKRQESLYAGLLSKGVRVSPGPADNQVFDVTNGHCIADDMAQAGVRWERSNKGPGSRITGLEMIRERLAATLDVPMERPGLLAFSTCRRWIEHVPVIQRDETNPEDVDSEQADHDYDATRYRLLAPRRGVSVNQELRI